MATATKSITGNVTPQDFAAAVLRELGIKSTTASISKLVAWEKQEGGNWANSATYNPLNTTLAMPGAGNTGTQGNIKAYTSWQQGLEATVKTLQGSSYAAIVANLKGGSDFSFETAVNLSPWGTKFNVGEAIEPQAGITGILEGKIPGFSSEGPGEHAATSAEENASVALPSVLGEVEKIWGTLSDPATWLRVLKVVGGLALAYLAIRQLSQAAGVEAPLPSAKTVAKGAAGAAAVAA